MYKFEVGSVIIKKSLPLIKEFVDNEEEYCRDIKTIYWRIKERTELDQLLEQEARSYSEERTIRIAEILLAASSLPLIVNGCICEYSPKAFRQKPALYFYERAAARDSIKAMGQVAFLLRCGNGDIVCDRERAQRLYRCAAEQGDLMSLRFAGYSVETLKLMGAQGNAMAYVAAFADYYKRNKKIRAKSCLKKFLAVCTPKQKDEVIAWMREDRLDTYLPMMLGLK